MTVPSASTASAPSTASTAPRRRRRLALVGLALGVLVLHGWGTRWVASRIDDFSVAAAAPARIDVAYVRTLEVATPTRVAMPPQRPAPAERRRHAMRPARAASQPPSGDLSAPNSVALAAETARASDPSPPAASASSVDPRVAGTPPSGAETSPTDAASSSAKSSAATDPTDAAPLAALPSGAAASAVPAFEWPASTRVSYHLSGNYRGEVSGSAQVEWIRAESRYQVHVDLVIGPAFAPIFSRRMSSTGQLGGSGLAPDRYDEDTKIVFREPRRFTVTFEPDDVVLANGQRSERWPAMQDTASQFIQLTWLFTTRPELLTVGTRLEMPLALPRGTDRWTYDVLGEDTLVTSFGTLQAFHLKPRRGVQKAGDLSAEIWYAPALRYLPVRIRIEQDAQTFIDMMIARKPELAAG